MSALALSMATALAAEPQVEVLAWDQIVLNHTPSGMCVFVLRFEPERLAQVSVLSCHQHHLGRALALIEQGSFEAEPGEHLLTVSFQAPRAPLVQFSDQVSVEQARAGDYRVRFDAEYRTELLGPRVDTRYEHYAFEPPPKVGDWSAPELLVAADPNLRHGNCSVLVGLTERGTVLAVSPLDCPDRSQLAALEEALQQAIFQPLVIDGSPMASQVRLTWGRAKGWQIGAPDPDLERWTRPKVIRAPKPSYPPYVSGKQGECKVSLQIDGQGIPTSATLEDCPLDWAGVVVENAFDYRFRPATMDDEPVDSEFFILYRFR